MLLRRFMSRPSPAWWVAVTARQLHLNPAVGVPLWLPLHVFDAPSSCCHLVMMMVVCTPQSLISTYTEMPQWCLGTAQLGD